MTCFHPLQGYKSKTVSASGKRKLVFKIGQANQVDGVPDSLTVACGQCVGCRVERGRQWAVRSMHEVQMHDQNCFITLTYDDDHLPDDRSLSVSDFQKFMKRLRVMKSRFPDRVLGDQSKIGFLMCGEYGETTRRPHYHAILYNCDFPDKVKCGRSRANGSYLYESKILSELWPYGLHWIGEANYDTSAYVSRYILKKITGDAAESAYTLTDFFSGEIFNLKPEFNLMSRCPGIGKTWLDKYGTTDVLARDHVRVNGYSQKPPRFYDNYFELIYPDKLQAIKDSRKEKALLRADDNTPERLAVRKVCLQRKLEFYKREL